MYVYSYRYLFVCQSILAYSCYRRIPPASATEHCGDHWPFLCTPTDVVYAVRTFQSPEMSFNSRVFGLGWTVFLWGCLFRLWRSSQQRFGAATVLPAIAKPKHQMGVIMTPPKKWLSSPKNWGSIRPAPIIQPNSRQLPNFLKGHYKCSTGKIKNALFMSKCYQ